MPYHISNDHAGCSGYAVVNSNTDEVVGCHPTKSKAQAHMAALYANVPDASNSLDPAGTLRVMAVDNSAWDGPRALAQCETAADYDKICAGVRTVGESGQRQHYALPHHYLANAPAPNADGVRAALQRVSQTENLANAGEARTHLENHMATIQNEENSQMPRFEQLREGFEVRAMPHGVEYRDANGKPPTLAGHFAVFDQWTEINSGYEGHFMERIAPGAAKKSISTLTPKVLFNHGHDSTMGDQILGTVRSLEEDDYGVRYEVDPFDGIPPLIRDGLKAGVYGSSFRFRVLRQHIDETPERSDYNPDGIPERTITEMRVFEFGPVSFPAYAGATAGMRSMTMDYFNDFGRAVTAPMAMMAMPATLDGLRAHLQSEHDATPGDEMTLADLQDMHENMHEAAASHSHAGENAANLEDTETVTQDAPAAADADHVTSAEARSEEHEPEKGRTDVVDPNRTLEELRERDIQIATELQRMDAEAGTGILNPTQQQEWDKLVQEQKEIRLQVEAKERRLAALDNPAERQTEPAPSFQSFNSIQRKSNDDIYDLSSVRGAFDNPAAAKRELQDRAMQSVERSTFADMGRRANKEDMQGQVEHLLHEVDDENATIARRILLTGHPGYEGAFWKKVQGREVTSRENDLIERTGLLTATSGYAMPYTLDPTVLLTSGGSYNPVRDIARVVQIAGLVWNGVNSAGVTAAFAAEQTEASDNTPTLTQPTVTVLKAQAFVPFTVESEQWQDLRSEMATEFADAKNRLEGQKFTVGTGSPEPQGFMVGATNLATTAATATLALADIDTLVDCIPASFEPNTSIVASRKFFSKVRQLGRTAGATPEWAPEGGAMGGNRPLLGYPTYFSSDVVSTFASSSLAACAGDFNKGFLIVDRVGMAVELVPHLFGGSRRYPTGERGVYAWWMTNSVVRSVAALRCLKML